MQRTISIYGFIIIFICTSCSSVRINNGKKLSNYLDDYIDTYTAYNLEGSLKTLMVTIIDENKEIKYVINDVPEEVVLWDIKNLMSNEDKTIYVGKYKGLLCKVQAEDTQNIQYLFEEIDENIINKIKQIEIIEYKEDKKLNFDLSLLNWNPELTIIYNLSQNTKEIIFNDVEHNAN